MALQLRRGTNAERAAETFAVGELIYTTDTKQIYVGDGSTQGGVLVSSSAASSPASLTQNLSLNGFNISGTGNISATAFVGDGSGLTGIASGAGIEEGQEYAIDIQGNVRGDDTTVLVDAALGRVSADHYGDGSNLTGITLNQLANVDTTGVTTNSVLKYDGADWVIGVDNNSGGGGGGDGITEGQTYDINITGDVLADDSTVLVNTATQVIIAPGGFTGDINGDLTGNSAGVHTGNVIGDVTGDVIGSVFGDDSTLIIDSVNNTVNAFRSSISFLKTRAIEPDDGFTTVTFQPDTDGTANGVAIEANDEQPTLRLSRVTDSDIDGNTSLSYGQISFGRDDVNGEMNPVLNVAYEDKWVVAVNEAGSSFAESQHLIFDTNGRLAVGTFTPGATLDVAGDIKIGSFTTAERDALTGANGMMLYNSTTNQLESYENGAWGATGGAGGASIGNFTLGSSTIDTTDSSGIIMTPAVTISSDLTVENDLVVTNTVTADRFVSTGTETPEISASANLNLTAGNAVVVTNSPLRMASFTTTERNALAAQNGDIVYNTTDNKFQGYENGAWANLI